MNFIVYSILYSIFYILPAYVANGAPVIFGGGKPIDMNKKFRGKPKMPKPKKLKYLMDMSATITSNTYKIENNNVIIRLKKNQYLTF